jgi:hypothetical protein
MWPFDAQASDGSTTNLPTLDPSKMQDILKMVLARSPATLGSSQIGDAMTAGLNHPQLNAAIRRSLPPSVNHGATGSWDEAPKMLPPASSLAPVNVHAPQGAAAGPQGGASAPQMDPGALSAAPPPQVAAAPPPVPTVPMPPTPVTQAAPVAGDGYSRWNGLDFGPSPSPASQASGPDVIQKLMSYFKNKDNPSS